MFEVSASCARSCKGIQPMVRLLAALEMKHTQVTQNWTQMSEVSASCARSDV